MSRNCILMENSSSPPRVSEILKSQQLYGKSAEPNDTVRIQADFGVGYVKIMGDYETALDTYKRCSEELGGIFTKATGSKKLKVSYNSDDNGNSSVNPECRGKGGMMGVVTHNSDPATNPIGLEHEAKDPNVSANAVNVSESSEKYMEIQTDHLTSGESEKHIKVIYGEDSVPNDEVMQPVPSILKPNPDDWGTPQKSSTGQRDNTGEILQSELNQKNHPQSYTQSALESVQLNLEYRGSPSTPPHDAATVNLRSGEEKVDLNTKKMDEQSNPNLLPETTSNAATHLDHTRSSKSDSRDGSHDESAPAIHEPTLTEILSEAQETTDTVQVQFSDMEKQKIPEESRTPTPTCQTQMFRSDETSASEEIHDEATDSTKELWDQVNSNPVEDHRGDPMVTDNQCAIIHGKRFEFTSPQSDSSNQAEHKQSEAEDQNPHKNLEAQNSNKAMRQSEGETQLPEPTKRTYTVKEASARLWLERQARAEENRKTNQYKQAASSSLDVRGGIHIHTLLDKRAADKFGLRDLMNAILQGMPKPPRIYKILADETDPKQLVTNEDVAKRMTWITGSNYLQKYFCWPCLLYSSAIWEIPVTLGYDEIVIAANIHQMTESHVFANVKLLVQESLLKRKQKAELEAGREYQIQFQLLLKRLIEIASNKTSASTSEYIDILNWAVSNDIDMLEFLMQKPDNFLSDFVQSNAPVISEAMEQQLHSKIVEEVEGAPFVAVIFEEITDVVDKSSVAVILRYTRELAPTERIVKLIKMGSSRTVDEILQAMTLVVQEFKLEEKLVGFTYSGTVISPRENIIFNKTVNRLYPKAWFFPYQEHNLKKIISQSLSHSPANRHFFYTTNELAVFLRNIKRKFDKLDSDKWDFEDFVTTLKNQYKVITEFFDEVVRDESEWDPAIVTQAQYFSHFLKSPGCQILVSIVSTVLGATDDLCDAQQSNVNIEVWERLLSEIRNKLSEMKNAGLQEILRKPVDAEYTKVFDQIVETVLVTVNHRFADLEMTFAGLPIETEYRDALSKFQKRIGMSTEDLSRLQVEAESFFRDSANTEQAMKTIYGSNVKHSNHLFAFLQFSRTIPTKESYASSKPAIHSLRSYLATNSSPKSLDVLVLTGEDILNRMRREEEFYDYIMEQCLQKTRNAASQGIH